MTVELDYAYLAEFAKAENGHLTAVNASFTEVALRQFPAHIPISVAGRVRRAEGEPDPEIAITISSPGAEDTMNLTFMLSTEQDAVVYDGKVANVFAVSGPVVCGTPGLAEITISINGVLARRLAFEVLDQS